MSIRTAGLCSVLGFLFMACGGAAAPNERVTSATAAVRAAEVAGAPGNPEASLLLKRAREGLAQAKAQMADGKNEDAALTLQKAEADADLALYLAREAAAKAEAQAAVDQVKAFKQKASE
ncbi:MAG: DUF4398 domain-containing protein [Polyangiaceae bacterium]|jgi:hypothetical protein|nr:DUF4398 domain-containing protein [Polyangiaceae bacterium]